YVGKRITAEREQLGRRQIELARAPVRDHPAISRAEGGESTMDIERLCQLALALGVEPGSLLPRLADLPSFLGMQGIETLTKVHAPKGDDYLEAVAAGARAYIAEHGRRPKMNGGDASEYVGFSTTWTAIH